MRVNQLLLTAALILSLGHSPCAFGMAGELRQPSLSFPADSPMRQSVMKVISDKQFAFVAGNFVNAHSILRYAGDAASLNAFLTRLAACPEAKIAVDFSKGGEAEAWTLDHEAWGSPNYFHIEVNLDRIAQAAVAVPK